jgi:hypothetical protein
VQLSIELIDAYIQNCIPKSSQLGRELLRRASANISPTTFSSTDTSRGFYVVCFCSKGDLLSQWRAYGGGGGGYALGFNAKALGFNANASENASHLQVQRVIYEKKNQQKLIEKLLMTLSRYLIKLQMDVLLVS